mgnify:CR=1 FL=1
MGIICYDIEIAEEVQGDWDAAKRGEKGVSSVVLYDSDTERYHLYDENTIDECMDHLNSADLLVGFNCEEFDKPCLQGYTGTLIIRPQFDILLSIWQALGGRRTKGWRLDNVCERTLNLRKNGNGESAPKLYAEGRFGELFDYNLNDVFLTRKLFNHIVAYGTVVGPDGLPLQLVEYPDTSA